MVDAARPNIGPPPILTPPAGWLGSLGLKSGGKQPAQVAQFLQPVEEMSPFYRAGARTLVSKGNGNLVTNAGMANIYTVPQGKVLLLESAQGSTAVFGAVASCYLQWGITDPGGQIALLGDLTPKFITGELGLCKLIGPYVALPGYSLTVFTSAAAAITATALFWSIYGAEVAA